jgi:predicted nucleic acid-binding protein
VGLILDSSTVIAAERMGETVEQLIERICMAFNDQDAALSAVGVTELVHGIYRAQSPELRRRREIFIHELLRDLAVYPYTRQTAFLAGRIDGEQQARGVTIPFDDLLIGVTALELGFSVLTVNLRHFRLIPNLQIVTL